MSPERVDRVRSLPAEAPALRTAARAVAVVSAGFCVLLGAAMLREQVRMVQADVLNDPGLIELRRQFAADPDNDGLKRRIRAADLDIRRVYFAHQERTQTGARVLLCGFLTLLASLAVLPLLREATPDLEALETQPSEWARRRLAQRGLTAGVLALAALAALVAWALRSAPEREPVIPAGLSETLAAPTVSPPEPAPSSTPNAPSAADE